jgi:hypothetical protein
VARYQDEELHQPNGLFITFSHQTLIAQHQVTPQEKDPPFLVNRIDTGSGGFPVRLLPLDIRQYVKKSESLCGDLIIKQYFLLVCLVGSCLFFVEQTNSLTG